MEFHWRNWNQWRDDHRQLQRSESIKPYTYTHVYSDVNAYCHCDIHADGDCHSNCNRYLDRDTNANADTG